MSLLMPGAETDEVERPDAGPALWNLVDGWRQRGVERIGFTNGCFDLFHAGHVFALRDAAGMCDRLVVAVNSDSSVRRLKGEDRPVLGEAERMECVARQRGVAAVVLMTAARPDGLIQTIRPEVVIKGAEYRGRLVEEGEIVAEWNGEIAFTPMRHDGLCTTALIEGEFGRARRLQREGLALAHRRMPL